MLWRTATFQHISRFPGETKHRHSCCKPTNAFFVSQNPQVEGVNQHRYIFDSKVPPPGRSAYLARYYSDSGLVILNAGTAHGVTIGAEFAFYATQDSHASGKALHTFIVKTSASFVSILSLANDASCQSLPTVFTVFQAKPGPGGTIRLHCADHNSACLICHDIRQLPHNIEFVNFRENAHLELSVRDSQIIVSVSDVKATVYCLDQKFPIMHTVDPTSGEFQWSFPQYIGLM